MSKNAIAVRQNKAAWHGPTLGNKSGDIAAQAYKRAVNDLEAELKLTGQANPSIGIAASIHDIFDVVEQARQKYHDASKEHTGARKWLEKLSSRIMHYGQVLDMLSQHHPEYVALAWGAVKFVLMGVINRATLVTKISQAIVAIGEVLPRADLNAELYPTDYMKAALARLYAYIIMFFQLCVRWYNRSPVGRLWSAIIDPYELDYRELLEQIKQSSNAVEDLANAGARMEIRQLNTVMGLHHAQSADRDAKLLEFQLKLETSMSHLIQIATSNKTITERVSGDVRGMSNRLYRMEFNDIVQFFAPVTLPNTVLLKVQSFARRDLTLSHPPSTYQRMYNTLRTWISSDRASIMVVRVGPRAQKQARDLATAIITTLKTNSQVVFWHLSIPQMSERAVSMEDVFKSIIFQALQHSGNLFAQFAEQLNLLKINGSHTDREWADLIGLLFSNIPHAFLIIETEGLHCTYRHDDGWAQRFLGFLQTIIDQSTEAGTQLKILLLVDGSALKNQHNSADDGSFVALLQAPTLVPPRLRHLARRTGLDTKGWKFRASKV